MQLTRPALVCALVLAVFSYAPGARAQDTEPQAPAAAPAQVPAPAPDSSPSPAPDAAPSPAPEGPVAPDPAAPASSNLTARAYMQVGAYADSTATYVLTPTIGGSIENPVAGYSVSGRYLVDVVSAASPDVVSTASPNWTEVRHAGNLGFKYKPGNYGVALNGITSYTPDYLAFAGGAQLTQDLDEKNLTLVEGYGYGHDTIGRTGTPFSVFSRDLSYHSVNLGVSRVVNRALVIGVFGDAIFERGDQSKPYRYIPIFASGTGGGVARGASATSVAAARLDARPLEQLPLERDRFALTGRLAWRLTSTTLRVEERIYNDSWGLRASTTDARYFVDLSRRFTVWPHLRFHAQNSVSFWQRAYEARGVNDLPALRAGDRELSSLMTVGAGGGLRVGLGSDASPDDIALTTTLDGYYTTFLDALYVTERFSALTTAGLEVTF